jgi:predicted enzyme related to lactoylglutathione lyase
VKCAKLQRRSATREDLREFDMHRRTGVTTACGLLRRPTGIALAGTILLLAAACATPPPPLPLLPPVSQTDTGLVMPGKFVWGDLVSQDAEASTAFYGALFGWTFETNGRYSTVMNRGVPIAGIVMARDKDRGTEWLGNLSVVDVERAAAAYSENGGLIEGDPVDAPDRGKIALVSSKGGAALLLVRASGGDPPDAHPVVGGWLWWELWTHDVEGAMNRLVNVAGYQRETIDLRDEPYRVLRDAKARRAGIMEAPPDVYPTWLPYFRVDDVDASVDQAVALGARLIEKSERSAILVDPNHAEFGIGFWALETDRIMQEAE